MEAWWGSPGRAPQGRAGRAEAEDGDRDKGGDTRTNSPCPLHKPPPATALQPQPQPAPHLLPVPRQHPGGTEGPPRVPSPAPSTPRVLRGRAGSSAGLTWRLLLSPWSQALLVCFCFSAEGRQGVNPSGARPASGTAAEPGRAARTPQPPPPAPALDSGQPHRAAHPARSRGWLAAPLRHVPGSPRGWGHLPWCCRDFSPSRAWLWSSSRCGGRVLGKKTLSGHSSPGAYCTLSRFSASPLAAPAETEGSARPGGHSRAATDAPPTHGTPSRATTAGAG